MKAFGILTLCSLGVLMSCSSPSDSASSEIGNPKVAVVVKEPNGELSKKVMVLWTDTASWHSNLLDAKAPETDTIFHEKEGMLDFSYVAKNDSLGEGILELVSDSGYLKVDSWGSGDTLVLEPWQEVSLLEFSEEKVWLESSGLSFQAVLGNEGIVKLPRDIVLNEARFFGGVDSDYNFWKGVSDSSSSKIKECKLYTGKPVSFIDTLNVMHDDISISALQILNGRTNALKSYDVDSLNVWSSTTDKKVDLSNGRFQTSVNIKESGLIALDISGEVPVCFELDFTPVENSKKVQWVLVYPSLNFDSSNLIEKEKVIQEAEMWQSSLAYLTKQATGKAYTFSNVEKDGGLDVLVMESSLSVDDFDTEQWSWDEIFDRLEVEVSDYENTRFVIYKMGEVSSLGQVANLNRGRLVAIKNPLVGLYPSELGSWDTLFSSFQSRVNYLDETEASGFGQYLGHHSGGAMSLLLASMAKYDASKADTTRINFQTGHYGYIRNLFTTSSNGEYLDPDDLFMEPTQIQDLIDSGWITSAK